MNRESKLWLLRITFLALAVASAPACGMVEVRIRRDSDQEKPTTGLPAETSSTLPSPAPTEGLPTPWPTPRPPGVTTVAVTPDGAVWYGFGLRTWPPSGGGGAIRVHSGETTLYGTQEGLPDDNVQLLKVAPDGTLWAAAGCHVVRFDGQVWQSIGPVCTRVKGLVLDMAFAPDGTLWMAGTAGLVQYDRQTGTMRDQLDLSLGLAHSLVVGADGTIWMSGWTGSLGSYYVGRFDGSEWTTFDTTELFDDIVTRVVVGPDGLLWCATPYHGVVRYDGHTWKEFTTADDLPSNRIVDIAVAPDGMIWVLTDRGLAHLQGEQWRAVDGTPPGAKVIAFAPDGTTWVGTDRGTVVQLEGVPGLR